MSLFSRKDLFRLLLHARGELYVLLCDGVTGIVCRQPDRHLVVHVGPLWVVIGVVDEICQTVHKCLGLDKVLEHEGFDKSALAIAIASPSREM